MPLPASAERTALVAKVADVVAGLSTGRLRIAIDGLTGAGKTSFGHELAAALCDLGRATMRASMDDFKYPWRHARERGYDRVSGEGYYRNAYDFGSARDLLLRPAGPSGSGEVALCGHDPLTGADHRDKKRGGREVPGRRHHRQPGLQTPSHHDPPPVSAKAQVVSWRRLGDQGTARPAGQRGPWRVPGSSR